MLMTFTAAPTNLHYRDIGVLDHAQFYSGLGLRVIPLHYPESDHDNLRLVCSCKKPDCSSPAKHPAGHLAPNGLKNATINPDTIRAWFANPFLNIGIATGKES